MAGKPPSLGEVRGTFLNFTAFLMLLLTILAVIKTKCRDKKRIGSDGAVDMWITEGPNSGSGLS